jgi:hypothetical protein
MLNKRDDETIAEALATAKLLVEEDRRLVVDITRTIVHRPRPARSDAGPRCPLPGKMPLPSMENVRALVSSNAIKERAKDNVRESRRAYNRIHSWISDYHYRNNYPSLAAMALHRIQESLAPRFVDEQANVVAIPAE